MRSVIYIINNAVSELMASKLLQEDGGDEDINYIVYLNNIKSDLKARHNICILSMEKHKKTLCSDMLFARKAMKTLVAEVNNNARDKIVIRLPNIHHVLTNVLFYRGRRIFSAKDIKYEVLSEGTLTYVDFRITYKYLPVMILKSLLSVLFMQTLYRPFFGRFDGLDTKRVSLIYVPTKQCLDDYADKAVEVNLSSDANLKLGAKKNKYDVMVLGQYLEKQIGKAKSDKINAALVGYIDGFYGKEAKVVYKPHPLSSDQNMLDRAKKSNWQVIADNRPVEELLDYYKIDVLIGIASTGLFMAKLFDQEQTCIAFGLNYLNEIHDYNYQKLEKLFDSVGVECVSITEQKSMWV